MAEPTFVNLGEARILVVDYSHARGTDLVERVARSADLIRQFPKRSLLILARVQGIEFSPDATRVMLDHLTHNAPYSLATAVVGLGHLEKTIPIANRLTGRDLRTFDDESEALAWLASQAPGAPTPDERIHFFEHEKERLLLIDLRDSTRVELRSRVTKAADIIRNEPLKSVLTLTLLHGLVYDEETNALMKDYVRGNRPYVLAGAVVGLDHLKRILLPLNRLTGRRLRAFDDIDGAKDWLVEEKQRQLKI